MSENLGNETRVEEAIEAFQNGNPVLAYDAADRESEVDMVYPPAAVGPSDVARMRNDAGGLVCVALSDRISDILELPFDVVFVDAVTVRALASVLLRGVGVAVDALLDCLPARG
jgi:3,4-dihydroxy 2-butanone 4-phosphate synthase